MDLKKRSRFVKVTQLELSQVIGITRSNLSHWFNNRRPIPRIHIKIIALHLRLGIKTIENHNRMIKRANEIPLS